MRSRATGMAEVEMCQEIVGEGRKRKACERLARHVCYGSGKLLCEEHAVTEIALKIKEFTLDVATAKALCSYLSRKARMWITGQVGGEEE